jgi:hypothetical protein
MNQAVINMSDFGDKHFEACLSDQEKIIQQVKADPEVQSRTRKELVMYVSTILVLSVGFFPFLYYIFLPMLLSESAHEALLAMVNTAMFWTVWAWTAVIGLSMSLVFLRYEPYYLRKALHQIEYPAEAFKL